MQVLIFQGFLGIIDANENDSDGIQKVLSDLQQYQAFSKDNTVHSSLSVAADQLSVERSVNCQFQLVNGFTPKDRLDGMHFEIADFHAEMKFMQVQRFYKNIFLYNQRLLIDLAKLSAVKLTNVGQE